jgi:hypothetical protein
MVLNSKIEVRDSKIAGSGLYCKERIAKGEMVSEPGIQTRQRGRASIQGCVRLATIRQRAAVDV